MSGPSNPGRINVAHEAGDRKTGDTPIETDDAPVETNDARVETDDARVETNHTYRTVCRIERSIQFLR